MNDNELQRKIDDIERVMVSDDPTLVDQFARLDPVSSRLDPVREPHRRVVTTLTAIGFVLLLSSIAMGWPVMLLAAAVTLLAGLAIDERDERRYRRAIRRRADAGHDTARTRSLAGQRAQWSDPWRLAHRPARAPVPGAAAPHRSHLARHHHRQERDPW